MNTTHDQKTKMHSLFIIVATITRLTLAQEKESFYSLFDKQPEVNHTTFENSRIIDALNSTKLYALKHSMEKSPFEIWYFKDTFKSLEDMSLTPELYNNQSVERSTTKRRLQNVMTRALLGQNIGVTVMGGSISAGGGMINDYSDLRGIYYRVFIDWWQKAIQPFTGSSIGLRNLAVGGTGSNFFSFCYKTLMKPQDNMDIVFLEFSVNDYILFKDSHLPRAFSLEELTRQLLSEESLPAVMFVNFIQGENFIPVCNNLENHGQTMLAWHYGITSLSMRESLCPNMENKKRPAMFSSDGHHASIIPHAQMAMMIIDNVRNALLEVIESSQQGFHLAPSHDLPRAVYYMDSHTLVPDPLCYTLITPDETEKFFNPSLSVTEIQNKGFKLVQDVAIGFRKMLSGQCNVEPSRTDGYGGWEAEKENSTLKLKIGLPPHGILGDNVTRDVAIMFRTSGHGGKAKVWLEKYKPEIFVDTYSPFGHTRLITVTRHVTSGSHVLTVKVVKEGTFLLCGIMAGGKSVL